MCRPVAARVTYAEALDVALCPGWIDGQKAPYDATHWLQDGRWEAAYDSVRTMTVPEDLQARLDLEPRARDVFVTLDRANRYAILYRVQTARKPETRARRIEQLVAMLAEGKKIP